MPFYCSVRRPSAAVLVALLALGSLAACAEPLPETPPRQLSSSPFHYPEDLWDAGVEGQTMLRLFISDRGTVDTARVERTSGYAAFDSAALRGASDLRFEPARRGEDAAALWVLLPVDFSISDAEPAPAPNP